MSIIHEPYPGYPYGTNHPFYGDADHPRYRLANVIAESPTVNGLEWKITCTYQPAPNDDGRTVRRRYELAPRWPVYATIMWLLIILFTVAYLTL